MISRILRLLKIIRIIGRYRLDELISRDLLGWPLSVLLKMNPWKLRAQSEIDRGTRLRRGLEELGPVFIKFGQALSTRRDLLPKDIADELLKLVDQVPPFSERKAISIAEKTLCGRISEIFMHFEETPIASASVAQVHSATLHNGKEVVVKIVRPGIEDIIRDDIDLLFSLAQFIVKYFKDGPRLRPVEIVSDYKNTITAELDLSREAANASQLRRNFQGRNLIYVPEVFWEYTSKNVYVMERIYGVPVNDIETLKSSNISLKVLAERGVETFFTQVFEDNFFHADMHPGNIFIDISIPDDPTYISVDCAIIGTLNEKEQYYLGRNLLAIFRRNYREVAELHLECGWVASNTNIGDFESTIRTLCEPIFERPIRDISLGQLLINLFRAARQYDMEVQPSLVLLQKTLLNIEGLGRQLYPELNLWDTALPFLENWIKDRYSPLSVLRRLKPKLPYWLEKFPELPDVLYSNLSENSNLKKELEVCHTEINDFRRKFQIERLARRLLSFVLLGIALSIIVLSIKFPSLFNHLYLSMFG